MTLQAHPYADLFPMLDAADADALRGDIAEHGLREKVVLYHDLILDGRNRYRALMEIAKLGLPYRGEQLTAADIEQGEFFIFFTGTETQALEYVLSKNLHRRHLTDGQRAHVAANLATLGQGRPEKNRQMAGLSQGQAAERLHVSKRQVERAVTVREHGIDDLNDAVRRGELKISVAAQLAQLTPDEQRELLAKHADRRALSGIAKDLRAERQKEKVDRRQERERVLGAKIAALPDRKYGVIIADPEWKYSVWNRETGGEKLPDNHYPTSELDAIKARDVGSIAADDCVLFLWVVAPFLDAGLDVLKAWGFEFVTFIVWNKLYPGDQHGLGYWFRVDHEAVLIGKRGNPPCPAQGTQFPSVFSAPVGEHSEKPDHVHRFAEVYFPNLPKIELNARRKRAGWDVWGNEADGGEDAEKAQAEHGQGRAADVDAISGDGAVSVAGASVARSAPSSPPSKEGADTGEPLAPLVRDDGATDADILERLTAAVSRDLGVAPSLGTGNGRTATPDERRLRRAVIVAAHDRHGMSTARIGAVLGIKKQSVHEQLQAARAKAKANAEAAE